MDIEQMLKLYFQLQYQMTNRWLRAYGLHPYVAYLLLSVVFVGFSILLFFQIAFAPYLYPLFPLYCSLNLAEAGRNDFLKICFKDKTYKVIRIMENILIAFPFIAFLLYKHYFLVAFLLACL
ncbi:MAG: hypothetical protein FWF52_01365 [Candidatus Azobacteroides sp.]|nr:hypothetical protein [Candidatus Azobacteroides sp.]